MPGSFADAYVESQGGSSETLPTNWSLLKAWWRADKGVTKDASDNVSQWTDQKSGYNWIQATGSKQPKYKANQINGKPVLEFTGASSQFMKWTGSWDQGQHDMTLFIVLKRSTGTPHGVLTFHNNTSASIIEYLLFSGTYFKFIPHNSSRFSWQGVQATISNPVMSYCLHILDRGNCVQVREGGRQLIDSFNSGYTNYTMTQGYLGCYSWATDATAYYYNGQIAEIIWFEDALNQADITLIEQYLSNRYGLYSVYGVLDPTCLPVIRQAVVQILSSTTIYASDVQGVLLGMPSTGHAIVKLPTGWQNSGRIFICQRGVAANAYDFKLQAQGSDTVEGGTELALKQLYETAILVGVTNYPNITYMRANINSATLGGLIGNLTAKSAVVDADKLALMDSEASNIAKSLSLTDLKAFLKTYFDTLYTPL